MPRYGIVYVITLLCLVGTSGCAALGRKFDEWGQAMPTYNDVWCEGWFCWNKTTTKEEAFRPKDNPAFGSEQGNLPPGFGPDGIPQDTVIPGQPQDQTGVPGALPWQQPSSAAGAQQPLPWETPGRSALPPGFDPAGGLPPGAEPGVNWPPPPEENAQDESPFGEQILQQGGSSALQ